MIKTNTSSSRITKQLLCGSGNGNGNGVLFPFSLRALLVVISCQCTCSVRVNGRRNKFPSGWEMEEIYKPFSLQH